MSTVQSSPESWLQIRPLDCAFLTLPYTPHKATTQKSRLLYENFDLLNFGILPLNLPLEKKSSGKGKKDKNTPNFNKKAIGNIKLAIRISQKNSLMTIHASSLRVRPDLRKTSHIRKDHWNTTRNSGYFTIHVHISALIRQFTV